MWNNSLDVWPYIGYFFTQSDDKYIQVQNVSNRWKLIIAHFLHDDFSNMFTSLLKLSEELDTLAQF